MSRTETDAPQTMLTDGTETEERDPENPDGFYSLHAFDINIRMPKVKLPKEDGLLAKSKKQEVENE